MGHTESTHRQFYRLPDDVIQTSKISKILLIAEKGGDISQYKGKNLEDIALDTENIEENPNDNDDDPKELENDSNEKFVSGEDLSEGKISKPKRSKTRKLVPWTDQQKKLLRDYFKMKIKNKVTPKKPEIMKLKESHPDVFKNKDWVKMKAFIYNEYTHPTKK